jgi:hypothetical protein
MAYFSPADHAMGLELQLEELREQQQRARVQRRFADADQIQADIEQLQAELAATAEILPDRDPGLEPPHLHEAQKLSLR